MAQLAVVLLALFGQIERTYTMGTRGARAGSGDREGSSCPPTGAYLPKGNWNGQLICARRGATRRSSVCADLHKQV
jgi:hypothetical protein